MLLRTTHNNLCQKYILNSANEWQNNKKWFYTKFLNCIENSKTWIKSLKEIIRDYNIFIRYMRRVPLSTNKFEYLCTYMKFVCRRRRHHLDTHNFARSHLRLIIIIIITINLFKNSMSMHDLGVNVHLPIRLKIFHIRTQYVTHARQRRQHSIYRYDHLVVPRARPFGHKYLWSFQHMPPPPPPMYFALNYYYYCRVRKRVSLYWYSALELVVEQYVGRHSLL